MFGDGMTGFVIVTPRKCAALGLEGKNAKFGVYTGKQFSKLVEERAWNALNSIRGEFMRLKDEKTLPKNLTLDTRISYGGKNKSEKSLLLECGIREKGANNIFLTVSCLVDGKKSKISATGSLFDTDETKQMAVPLCEWPNMKELIRDKFESKN